MEKYDTGPQQEQQSRQQGELPGQSLSAQEVADYLRRHPRFLIDHADLLSDIDIPHTESQGAVSLIERQVQLLRERQRYERGHLEDLILTARDNERVAERLHRLAVEVTGVSDLDNALSTVPQLISELFDVRFVALRIMDQPAPGSPKELVPQDDPAFGELRARVAHGRSVSDDRLPAHLRTYLFGQGGDSIESCVLIPVGGKRPSGVLALASEAHDRFQPNQGTLYLDRMGELVGALMERLLR